MKPTIYSSSFFAEEVVAVWIAIAISVCKEKTFDCHFFIRINGLILKEYIRDCLGFLSFSFNSGLNLHFHAITTGAKYWFQSPTRLHGKVVIDHFQPRIT